MKSLIKFDIGSLLSGIQKNHEDEGLMMERYRDVLEIIKIALDQDWESSDDQYKRTRLERQKGAIIGIERDVNDIKEKIRMIVAKRNLLSEPFPSYYPNLIDAVFSDLYGLSGVAPWAYDWKEEYKDSSSAKLIGEDLYCLIDGKTRLEPQKIDEVRRGQLQKALLLATPKERLETGFHEVYLHNGIRVTIYSGDRCKPGQDIIVFRKYVLKNLSFEGLADCGTFPKEAIPLFKAMCRIGYNVVFAGQVRSGKTTFLQVWQSYEDPRLEGVTVATDPETRWEEILPKAPIMQLVADGKELTQIEKSLKRSDADYVILEEMRDAVSYNLFLGITNLGTMRSKGTIHDNSALNIPYKMATAIVTEFGGNEEAIISQLFNNINYVFELYQVPENKALKKLKRIIEYRYDPVENRVSATTVCKYDARNDVWLWNDEIGSDKEEIATGYEDSFGEMKSILSSLAKEHPLTGVQTVYPSYYRGNVLYQESEKRVQAARGMGNGGSV